MLTGSLYWNTKSCKHALGLVTRCAEVVADYPHKAATVAMAEAAGVVDAADAQTRAALDARAKAALLTHGAVMLALAVSRLRACLCDRQAAACGATSSEADGDAAATTGGPRGPAAYGSWADFLPWLDAESSGDGSSASGVRETCKTAVSPAV